MKFRPNIWYFKGKCVSLQAKMEDYAVQGYYRSK